MNKSLRTMPKSMEDGYFVFIPQVLIQKIAKLLNIRNPPSYVVETIVKRSLSDFVTSDIFLDYRCAGYDTPEILDTFEAETEETIREIVKELKWKNLK